MTCTIYILAPIFLTSFSCLPSEYLSKDGDPLFTSYEATELLKNIFETIVTENKIFGIKTTA